MGEPFVALARRGLNDWWRYLLGVLLITFGWIFLGSLLSTLVLGVGAAIFHPGEFRFSQIDEISRLDPLLAFVAENSAFILFALSVLVAVKVIHRRPIITLITTRPPVDWGRIGLGFVLWFALAGLAALVEALLYPERYQVTINLVELLKFLPFALVLTPIQTTAEELFVRGYLLQGLGFLMRAPLGAAVFTSLLFMSLHAANPEMELNPWLMAAGYFGFGFLACLITLKDNRMELALGVHAGNNIFSWVVVNYTASPLSSPSLFTSVLEPTYSLISFIAMAVVFYVIVFHPPWRSRTATTVPQP